MKRTLFAIALFSAALCFSAPVDDFRAVLTAAKSLEAELRSANNAGQASEFDVLDATLTRLRAEIALSYAVQNAGLLSKVEAARLRLRVATFRLEISEALAPAWDLN